MTVRDIMSTNVATCNPNTSIQQVARMLIEHDCGEIPIVDQNGMPVGVVTDRDICCRAVAECVDCNGAVSQVMTSTVVTCDPSMDLEQCCNLMEQHMIRRMPVVDEQGCLCGIVSQADFAKKTGGEMVDDLLKEISTPTRSSANL